MYTPTMKANMLKDINLAETFANLINISEGKRTKSLIYAVNLCDDLNSTKERAIDIINILNSTYNPPLNEKQMDGIMRHLNKRFSYKEE